MDNSKIIEDSWNRCLFCFGTAAILNNKIRKLRLGNKLIKFFGLGIPLIIGGVVTSFSLNASFLPILLIVLGGFAVIQLVLSLWSLIDGWDNKIEVFSESKVKNSDYYDQFKTIASNFDSDTTKYESLYKELKIYDDIQRKSDEKICFSNKDKRFGMRAGLFQLQKECVSCKKIPDIKKPTKCSVCGK